MPVEPVVSTPDATVPAHTAPFPPRVPLWQIYALPAPIRTFPLPTFYPNNPISLLHLAYTWLRQVVSPPAAEPSVDHVGVWDPDTRSVHINDPKSIRALWEQGFFGKGSLSRSEPNWLKRELGRLGTGQEGTVSEVRTDLRREERRNVKWERAKAELEAIEQQRLEEARAEEARLEEVRAAEARLEDAKLEEARLVEATFAETQPAETKSHAAPHPAPVEDTPPRTPPGSPRPPVGPAELLALPNTLVSLVAKPVLVNSLKAHKSPVGPAELLALPNSLASVGSGTVTAHDEKDESMDFLSPDSRHSCQANGHVNGKPVDGHARPNGLADGADIPATETSVSTTPSVVDILLNEAKAALSNGPANGIVSPPPSISSANGSVEPASNEAQKKQPLKRRKSVRFSPQVESTTFQHHDPPSPRRSASGSPPRSTPSTLTDRDDRTEPVSTPSPASPATTTRELVSGSTPETPIAVGELTNKEHFQLAPEEAFFLVFALGVLSVVDPVTLAPIPTDKLLDLLRAYSYFPPREVSSPLASLQPQDPFLVNYAVYHHFRSLGWVPRHGIKFGVDFILYQRGPVFDHSEFGVMVMPTFSDGRWKQIEHEAPKKSWSWLMGVNRVLAHVLKSLVLVYVDIPPPSVFDEAMQQGGIAEALKKYTIREVMVRRFSANRNR